MKKGIWLYGIAIGLLLIVVILFVPFKNPLYMKYYERACEQYSVAGDVEDVQRELPEGWGEEESVNVKLCRETNGCYNYCGSACPPEQKTNLINSVIKKTQFCITVCVPQCVCPYGKILDNEKGCTDN